MKRRSLRRAPRAISMRLPGFLVIGAMKAGTTSLYADLDAQPAVFMPEDKEPDSLVDDAVLTAAGRAGYASLFRDAAPEQLCGEASTAYSKLPVFPGVPRRARRLLGAGLKVIYLVREPVARVISQHYHELAGATVDPDVDVAVRRTPRLVDYSRYAMQIEPWIDELGEANVRIVRFESYVADRPGTVAALLGFLGLPATAEPVDSKRVFNPSALARARRGPAFRFSRSAFYRRLIRPWLSRPVRSRLRLGTLPKAPPKPPPPRLDTVDYILERVAGDAERVARLAGWDRPMWDLAEVRRRWAERAADRASDAG